MLARDITHPPAMAPSKYTFIIGQERTEEYIYDPEREALHEVVAGLLRDDHRSYSIRESAARPQEAQIVFEPENYFVSHFYSENTGEQFTHLLAPAEKLWNAEMSEAAMKAIPDPKEAERSMRSFFRRHQFRVEGREAGEDTVVFRNGTRAFLNNNVLALDGDMYPLRGPIYNGLVTYYTYDDKAVGDAICGKSRM